MSQPTVKVTMYRTQTCPFCVAAEELLDAKGVSFEQIYLDDHPDRRAFTAEILAGHQSVPLIVIDGKALGGLDSLRELEESGELSKLLGQS